MTNYRGVNPAGVEGFYGLVPTPVTVNTMAMLNLVKERTKISTRAIAAGILEHLSTMPDVDALINAALPLMLKYDARIAHQKGRARPFNEQVRSNPALVVLSPKKHKGTK